MLNNDRKTIAGLAGGYLNQGMAAPAPAPVAPPAQLPSEFTDRAQPPDYATWSQGSFNGTPLASVNPSYYEDFLRQYHGAGSGGRQKLINDQGLSNVWEAAPGVKPVAGATYGGTRSDALANPLAGATSMPQGYPEWMRYLLPRQNRFPAGVGGQGGASGHDGPGDDGDMGGHPSGLW